jgi:hypothetical protein
MTQAQFPGQFPLTAPDLAVSSGVGGMVVDMDDLGTETISEQQNLQQDLMNRMIELPGSNLDFGTPNNRGIGIMTYLNASSDRLVGLPARIDAEFEQDARVRASLTTPITVQADGSYLIASQIETVAGVFGYAWSWSQAGVVPVPYSGP